MGHSVWLNGKRNKKKINPTATIRSRPAKDVELSAAGFSTLLLHALHINVASCTSAKTMITNVPVHRINERKRYSQKSCLILNFSSNNLQKAKKVVEMLWNHSQRGGFTPLSFLSSLFLLQFLSSLFSMVYTENSARKIINTFDSGGNNKALVIAWTRFANRSIIENLW